MRRSTPCERLPYPPIRRQYVNNRNRSKDWSSGKLLVIPHLEWKGRHARLARRAISASHAARICAIHCSRASAFCANMVSCASVSAGGAWSLLFRARAVRSSKRSSICRKVIRPPLSRLSCLTGAAVGGSGLALASALDFGRCESVAPVAVMALGALSSVEDAPLSSGARFVG